MSAYGTSQNQLHALPQLTEEVAGGSAVDVLVTQLAERVAALVVDRLSCVNNQEAKEEWFDSRHAARYLGVHRDTLRKLAAERTIPSEQDGPGCKLYFRRSDLEAWRQGAGRSRLLTATLAPAA
jgi:excisionase family DNA binding protein